jgi:hypothetical protein
MSFDYTSLEYLLSNTDCFISAIKEIQFFLPDGTPYKKISEGAQQEICAIKSFLFDTYKAFVARLKVDTHAESWKLLIKFCDDFHVNAKYSTLCDTIEKFADCINRVIKEDGNKNVNKSIKKPKKV